MVTSERDEDILIWVSNTYINYSHFALTDFDSVGRHPQPPLHPTPPIPSARRTARSQNVRFGTGARRAIRSPEWRGWWAGGTVRSSPLSTLLTRHWQRSNNPLLDKVNSGWQRYGHLAALKRVIMGHGCPTDGDSGADVSRNLSLTNWRKIQLKYSDRVTKNVICGSHPSPRKSLSRYNVASVLH